MSEKMSKENRILPKEMAIYEAYISLRDEGKNLGDIKVSDIASKAGIGKGTVYEYFSSKEEIIMKAIVYEHNKKLNELASLVTSQNKFQSKLDIALEWMGKNGPKAILTIQQVKQNKELDDKHPEFCEQLLGQGVFDSLDQLANQILEAGVTEEIIRAPKSSMERDMILSAVAAAFMSYISRADSYKDSTLEEAKQVAMQILLMYLK